MSSRSWRGFWGIQYLEFIDKVVGSQQTSQIIMCTHNPLVISSLERQQVWIMQRDDETGKISAVTPNESPRGMGVDGILTSDIFGLRSTLDIPTQQLIDRRRILAVKDTLRPEEEELERLEQQLGDIDFSIGNRDSDFTRFIREKTIREDEEIREQVVLTPEQYEEQKDLMRKILDELAEEEQEA